MLTWSPVQTKIEQKTLQRNSATDDWCVSMLMFRKLEISNAHIMRTVWKSIKTKNNLLFLLEYLNLFIADWWKKCFKQNSTILYKMSAVTSWQYAFALTCEIS